MFIVYLVIVMPGWYLHLHLSLMLHQNVSTGSHTTRFPQQSFPPSWFPSTYFPLYSGYLCEIFHAKSVLYTVSSTQWRIKATNSYTDTGCSRTAQHSTHSIITHSVTDSECITQSQLDDMHLHHHHHHQQQQRVTQITVEPLSLAFRSTELFWRP